MKKANATGNNIIRIITALLISMLMCFCMCACGSDSNTEETIEITTPSEETTAPADDETKAEDTDQDEDEDGSDSSDSDEEIDASSSQYAKIYKDCNAEMKKATAKYVDELKEKASSVSKSKLYDETQDRIDALKKIYDGSKDKMVDAMLASTEDDAKDYEKYFTKMTEAYTEYSRELTTVYTDAF